MTPNFQFRLVVSAVLFTTLRVISSHVSETTLLGLILLAVWLIDISDCFIYNTFIASTDCGPNDLAYQKTDKILDWITYLAVFFLFHKIFDKTTRAVYFVLLVYRLIGVLLFVQTGNRIYLAIFFDGLNVVLLLMFLVKLFPTMQRDFFSWLIVGLLLKFFYEVAHHVGAPQISAFNIKHVSQEN